MPTRQLRSAPSFWRLRTPAGMVTSCDSSIRELLVAASGILRRVSRYSFALCKFAYASSLSSLSSFSLFSSTFASYSAAAATYLAKAASYLHCAATAAVLTAGAARAVGSASAAFSAAASAGTWGVEGEAGGGMRPPRRPEAAAAAKAGKSEEGTLDDDRNPGPSRGRDAGAFTRRSWSSAFVPLTLSPRSRQRPFSAGKPKDICFLVVLVDVSAEGILWEEEEEGWVKRKQRTQFR